MSFWRLFYVWSIVVVFSKWPEDFFYFSNSHLNLHTNGFVLYKFALQSHALESFKITHVDHVFDLKKGGKTEKCATILCVSRIFDC